MIGLSDSCPARYGEPGVPETMKLIVPSAIAATINRPLASVLVLAIPAVSLLSNCVPSRTSSPFTAAGSSATTRPVTRPAGNSVIGLSRLGCN